MARDAKEACPLLQMMDSSGKRLTRDSEENWANLDFYHHSAISSAEIFAVFNAGRSGIVRLCPRIEDEKRRHLLLGRPRFWDEVSHEVSHEVA